MRGRRRPGRLRVVGDQGPVDRGVLAPRAFERALLLVAAPHPRPEGARRQALQDRRHRVVAGRHRDLAVEGQVVGEDLLRVVGGVHRREVFLDLGQLVGRDAGGGQRGRRRFEDAAHLEQLHQTRAPGQVGDHAEGLQQVTRLQLGDVDARAVPGLQDAHHRQRLDRLPHRTAGEAQLDGQITLGRQPLAGLQPALADHRLDLLDGALRHGALLRSCLVHAIPPHHRGAPQSNRQGGRTTMAERRENLPTEGIARGEWSDKYAVICSITLMLDHARHAR